MDAVLKQLRELTARLSAMSTAARLLILGGVAVMVLGFVVWRVAGSTGRYEYAFTNLSPEDSGEAAAALKTAGIQFRLEAGGSALAVPASQVYDARLLLAAAGLPRGGGVGFELFDRGDFGVSDFTQRVNLRRAIEGELARTIGRLSSVRSARVHITLPEKGLYRDEDRRASAAVVINLQPGRSMSERELQGIRHLVASATAGLTPDAVTIVDGRGGMLAGETTATARASTQQREAERSFEQRIIDLLEPAMGPGAVVARVTAVFDNSEVDVTADAYDPDATAVRTEHRATEQTNQNGPAGGGVAGAAANQPLSPALTTPGGSTQGSSSREDETRNYEISKKVTRTVTRTPRLQKLSVAVLLDSTGQKAMSAAELQRLGELAKSAVGFDASRGDQFQLTSAPFTHRDGDPAAANAETWWKRSPAARWGALGGAAALLIAILLGARLLTRRKTNPTVELLKPGARVSEIEAHLAEAKQVDARPPALALPDPATQVRDRAKELTTLDPARAAQLLRNWLQSDADKESDRA